MRKFLIAAALVVLLGGCAQVQTAYDTVTGARVSPQAVYVASNVFDGFERTATNYLRLCHQHPDNLTCSKTAEVEIVKAVRSGISARKKLRSFMNAHPDALGAKGLYDAFLAASDVLQNTLARYGVNQ